MLNSTFRDLHRDFLLLPNAWDPGSARLIESLGAKASATTSAGVAWSRGFPDGDALPVEELLITVRAIARVIQYHSRSTSKVVTLMTPRLWLGL